MSTTPIPTIVSQVCAYVDAIYDEEVILLRNPEVIMWLFGDLSFLPVQPVAKGKSSKRVMAAQLKKLEDAWGRAALKTRRPDLKLDKQWTNKFGEHLAFEILRVIGEDPSIPKKKENYQPDLQDQMSIWEVKTGTYHTTGTAGEKILGCPFKYADVPDLFGKPLKIMCLGGAEKACREQYGNLEGGKCTRQKAAFIAFFSQQRIDYVAATDLLRAAVSD